MIASAPYDYAFRLSELKMSEMCPREKLWLEMNAWGGELSRNEFWAEIEANGSTVAGKEAAQRSLWRPQFVKRRE